MRKQLTLISLCFICSFAQSAIADRPATQWDRGSAMAAVRTINIEEAVDEISNIYLLIDKESALNELRNIENRSDWPLPAREAVIFQFTRSLADLPRAAVSTAVMQHLQNYQARILVPHEDHGDVYVPLFNIRAAATGVENTWQRVEFALEADKLLNSNPAALVAGYVDSSNHNQRSAYLDSLQHADLAAVVTVQDIVLQQIDEMSVLTPVLGTTTAITQDILAIKQLLTNGQGVGLSSALKQLNLQLPLSDTAALLQFSIHQAPASNATLAIAAWWPRLSHEADIRDLMVEILADPALGASAALALAQNPDIQTIKTLQDTARGDSVAARRAQMALDVNRARLIGEVRP